MFTQSQPQSDPRFGPTRSPSPRLGSRVQIRHLRGASGFEERSQEERTEESVEDPRRDLI